MLRLVIIALIFMNLTWFISCTFEEKARQYISGLPKNYEEVTNLLKENYGQVSNFLKENYGQASNLLKENYGQASNLLKGNYGQVSNFLKENYGQASNLLKENYGQVSNLLKENYKDAAEMWKDISKKSKPFSLDNMKKVLKQPKSLVANDFNFGKINSNVDNCLLRKMVHGSPASVKKPKKFGGKLVKFLFENKYFVLLISIVFLGLGIGVNGVGSMATSAMALFMVFIPVIISLILIIKMVKIEKKYYRDNGLAGIIVNYFKKNLGFIL